MLLNMSASNSSIVKPPKFKSSLRSFNLNSISVIYVTVCTALKIAINEYSEHYIKNKYHSSHGERSPQINPDSFLL